MLQQGVAGAAAEPSNAAQVVLAGGRLGRGLLNVRVEDLIANIMYSLPLLSMECAEGG